MIHENYIFTITFSREICGIKFYMWPKLKKVNKISDCLYSDL